MVQVGDYSGAVANVRLTGLNFVGLTSAGLAAACIRVHGNTARPVIIDNIKFTSIACPAILVEQAITATGIALTGCTSTSPAMQLFGTRCVVRNVTLDTVTGSPIYVTGADCELDGVTVIDYGASASAGVQFEAGSTGSIVRNASFFQRTSIPGGTYAIRYNGVTPRILSNVAAKSAGMDFTSANIFGFLSGTSGAYISTASPIRSGRRLRGILAVSPSAREPRRPSRLRARHPAIALWPRQM